MISVQIISPDAPRRFVDLDRGAHRFGADIECDVVLPADAAEPLHFVLDVTENGVSIEVADGAEARLSRWFRPALRLAPGRRTHWRPGAKLRIDDLVVRIRGEECKSRPSLLGRLLAGLAAHSGRMVKVGGVVLLSVGVVSVTADILLREITGGADPSAAQAKLVDLGAALSQAPARVQDAPPPTPAPAPETSDQVAAALTERGFAPETVGRVDGGWRATFYLGDARARIDLDAALADAPFKISPVVYLDTAMKEAVSLVLANANATDVEVQTLAAGALELSSRARDAGERRALREILLSDVRGLREVTFAESTVSSRVAALQNEVMAIWSGARPYVALKDGRRVKVGQSLAPGVDLIAITSAETLLLSVGGKEEEFELK